MKTTESISHTKFETEFLLKFYVDQKCCEDNFKKNQNCEISDSVDSHHLGSWSRWWSEGRQEERVYQDSHQAHPHCRDSEKRQSRWRFIFCAFLLWYFNWWFYDLILFIFMQFESVQIQRFTNFLFLITAATQHIQTRVDWDYNVDEWKEMPDDGNEDK